MRLLAIARCWVSAAFVVPMAWSAQGAELAKVRLAQNLSPFSALTIIGKSTASGIHKAADLKGKKIAYTAGTGSEVYPASTPKGTERWAPRSSACQGATAGWQPSASRSEASVLAPQPDAQR